MFLDLGGIDKVDLNFCTKRKNKPSKACQSTCHKEDSNHFKFRIFPIMSCVAKGKVSMLNIILKNKTVNINAQDPFTGVSSFWLACLYGHGSIMKIIAENGADIYIVN
jgi:hypothetical protein